MDTPFPLRLTDTKFSFRCPLESITTTLSRPRFLFQSSPQSSYLRSSFWRGREGVPSISPRRFRFYDDFPVTVLLAIPPASPYICTLIGFALAAPTSPRINMYNTASHARVNRHPLVRARDNTHAIVPAGEGEERSWPTVLLVGQP